MNEIFDIELFTEKELNKLHDAELFRYWVKADRLMNAAQSTKKRLEKAALRKHVRRLKNRKISKP